MSINLQECATLIIFAYICSMLDLKTQTYDQISFCSNARSITVENVRGEQIAYTVVAAENRQNSATN